MNMAGIEKSRQKQFSTEALLVFAAIFVLALSLLMVSIRLLQQPVAGVHPTTLLVLSVIGIAGSSVGLLVAIRSSAQTPAPVEPSLSTTPVPENGEQQENAARVRLGKYVQSLEEQLQSLRQERDQYAEENGELRNKVKLWQERSLEMFSLLEDMSKSNLAEEGERQPILQAKKHLAQLVAPLGVGLIEPAAGDAFDPLLHQAENSDHDRSAPLVVQDCLAWGYTLNGEVHTPAKVLVASAEERSEG